METSGRNCRSLRRSLSLVISFLLFLSGPSPVMRLSKMTPPQHIAAPQLRPAASFPIKASDHSRRNPDTTRRRVLRFPKTRLSSRERFAIGWLPAYIGGNLFSSS